jgi:hypothetical protein
VDSNNWKATASSNQFRLSELNPENATSLAPGASFDLGPLFNAGTQDLAFQFLQSGQQFATAGVVLYAALSSALPGDFDSDGDVDGRDFLRWQRGGSPNPLSAGDLALWQNNYGNGGLGALATATSVPEPSALLLSFAGLGAIFVLKRQPGR